MSTIIKVKCTDQVLTFENTPAIASGGIGEDFVSFEFCSKWDGLAKTAVFWRTEVEAYHAVLDMSDTCIIPAEVLTQEGPIYFGVFGVDADGNRRTSEVQRYLIGKGVITENTKPSDPTPDIYTQLLAQYAEVLGVSTSAANAASASADAAKAAQSAAKTAASDAASVANVASAAQTAANAAVSTANAAKSAVDNHTHTATDVGALPITGGTMTGNISTMNEDPIIYPASASEATRFRLYSGRNAVFSGGAGVIFQNKYATSEAGNFDLYAHDGTNASNLKGTPTGDLTWRGHGILHANNYSDYALPLNGSKAMTGALTIEKSAIPFCKVKDTTLNRCAETRVDSGGNVLLTNRADDENFRGIVINQEDTDLSDALTIGQKIDGVWSSATVLHTGNKSLIAPADIGAFATSGNLNMGNADPVIYPTTASGAYRIRIYSGLQASNKGGAGMILHNVNASADPGKFELYAANGTSNYVLKGTNNGTLTWTGQTVLHMGNAVSLLSNLGIAGQVFSGEYEGTETKELTLTVPAGTKMLVILGEDSAEETTRTSIAPCVLYPGQTAAAAFCVSGELPGGGTGYDDVDFYQLSVSFSDTTCVITGDAHQNALNFSYHKYKWFAFT